MADAGAPPAGRRPFGDAALPGRRDRRADPPLPRDRPPRRAHHRHVAGRARPRHAAACRGRAPAAAPPAPPRRRGRARALRRASTRRGSARRGPAARPPPRRSPLLTNPNVVLTATGVAEHPAGRIDPHRGRAARLATAHVITVGALCSDHAQFTAGGAMSPRLARPRRRHRREIDGCAGGSHEHDERRELAVDLVALPPEVHADGGRQPVRDPGARVLHRRLDADRPPRRLRRADRSVVDGARRLAAPRHRKRQPCTLGAQGRACVPGVGVWGSSVGRRPGRTPAGVIPSYVLAQGDAELLAAAGSDFRR